MCGICLLVHQTLAKNSVSPRLRHVPHRARHLSSLTASQQDSQKQNHFCNARQRGVRDAEAGGVPCTSCMPDEHYLTPCLCEREGLELRSFLNHTGEGEAALFKEVIHNLRRRGPDTHGVTQRIFSTLCHASAGGDETRSTSPQKNPASRAKVMNTNIAADKATGEEMDFSVHSEGGSTVNIQTEVAGVASVLGLRGLSTVAQPYDVSSGMDAAGDGSLSLRDSRSSLLWNGEIFGGALCPSPWGSDTVLLANRLSQMERECLCITHNGIAGGPLLPLAERQLRFLQRCTALFEQQVEGPYSFIFVATRLQLAIFGRDPLGRHSLLTHVRVTTPSSVAAPSPTGISHVANPSTVTATPNVVNVEIVVSSVGVQHRESNGRVSAACAASCTVPGDSDCPIKEPNQPSSPSSPSFAVSHRDACASLSVASVSPTAAREGGQSVAKFARLELPHQQDNATVISSSPSRSTAGAAPKMRTNEENEPEEDDNDDEICWQEVGVTGLFGIPFQVPLLRGDSSAATASRGATGNGEAPGDERDANIPSYLHPFTVIPSGGVAGPHQSLAGGVRIPLLHVPWQRANHLVHPLLRMAPHPLVVHNVPTFDRILAHEEIAVLPEPLLKGVRHLMRSIPLDGDGDRSWLDWAAAHYMLALAVSMHRRITVANSGVADGSDAQELSCARRRPLCILFSGGIDCTVLAALAHYLLPVETPIELVNVAFGDTPAQAPDRVTALHSIKELLRLPLLHKESDDPIALSMGVAATPPEREWRLVLVDVPSKNTSDTAHIKDLLVPRRTVMDFDIGTALWYAARGEGRVQMLRRSDVTGSVTRFPPETEASPTTLTSAAGGIDGDRSPVTLDAFSKHFRAYTRSPSATMSPHRHGAPEFSRTSDFSSSLTMDTAASHGTMLESSSHTPSPSEDSSLSSTLCKYEVLVNILVKEAHIGTGPHTPVLLSTLGKEYSLFLQPHLTRYGYKKLGCFLNDAAKAGYVRFAPDAPSKAVRLCRPCDLARAASAPLSPWFITEYMKSQTPDTMPDGSVQPLSPRPGTFLESYVSEAKVVLLGMGADETLGGYTRYRRFYQRAGMLGAQRELERDFARLWQRNLGRDDRITMDSGREPRFPYLDEGVIRTLEWIVLMRRNSLLSTARERTHHHNEHSTTSGTASPHSSHAVSSSSSSPQSPAVMSDPAQSLTHDELLRLSMEPIVSFRLKPGEGDKRVLRRLAAVLGLSDVTHLEKRAIQFGSRIAERKVKGTSNF